MLPNKLRQMYCHSTSERTVTRAVVRKLLRPDSRDGSADGASVMGLRATVCCFLTNIYTNGSFIVRKMDTKK
ncbi:hypothetical protein Y032_0181g833 [Ancylostoma ceylanicum]|uniref:Uncharacterized protein n=1 Tax=Ancylostoma ceylanicum TaxID=53326 RepID=A0A016SSZ1_9BILA|nr:hypothetical protein Y032_0181g833 [Ancylostoma ceylanicum]